MPRYHAIDLKNRTNIILNEIPLVQRRMQNTLYSFRAQILTLLGCLSLTFLVWSISTKPGLTSYRKGHTNWIWIIFKEGERDGYRERKQSSNIIKIKKIL
jgi:hypothetical protein